MNINDVIDVSKKVSHEIGGHVNVSKQLFHHTANAQINQRNSREFVMLPNDKKVVWHVHPTQLPWWPSYEDLLFHGKRKVQIIFTAYGVWIIGKPSRTIDQRLKYIQADFHKSMMRIVQTKPSWNVQVANGEVAHFITQLESLFGYRIGFFDNGLFRRNITNTNYKQQLSHFIQMFSF